MARDLTPEAVMAAVEQTMAAHWAWGRADCCTAACDVFAALQGRDPMAGLRGQYATAGQAARLIRRWGGFEAMAAALAEAAGLGACPTISQARPGAIGLSLPGAARGPARRALLICIQPGAWAGKTLDGFAVLPTAERCWNA